MPIRPRSTFGPRPGDVYYGFDVADERTGGYDVAAPDVLLIGIDPAGPPSVRNTPPCTPLQMIRIMNLAEDKSREPTKPPVTPSSMSSSTYSKCGFHTLPKSVPRGDVRIARTEQFQATFVIALTVFCGQYTC